MRFRPAPQPPLAFEAPSPAAPAHPPGPAGNVPRGPRPPHDALAVTEALFHAALERPAAERAGWLRAQHPDDPELVSAVLGLLAADEVAAAGGESVWLAGGCLAELLADADTTTTEGDAESLAGVQADGRVSAGTPASEGEPGAGGGAPRLAPGDRVGVYRVVRLLGRGGMGTVHLAERVDVGSRVALKLVRAAHARDARAAAQFLAERRALARLEHPNVARLLDAGIVESGPAAGVPWFAMEYVDGEPIDQACDRRRLGVRARLTLFATVCDAVEAAHRHLVVHRDLKPSNVLVTDDGRPMLLDFGIAATLDGGDGSPAGAPGDLADDDPASDRPAPDRPNRLLTPQYAAPEQVRGEAPSVSVDVYALGLLLFELLTGRRPYDVRGRTRAAAVQAVLDGRVPPPSAVVASGGGAEARAAARSTHPAALRRALRGDVDAIVQRATARDPAARYATVGALAADVRRTLAFRPVTARRFTGLAIAAYRGGRLIRRHLALAAASAVVVGTAATGAASYVRTARVVEAERDRARASAERALRVRGALVALFEAANPDLAGQAPARSAEALLRRGELMADSLADQPDTQADLLVAIGQAWVGMGDPRAATRAFQRAVDVRRAHLAPDDPRLAEAQRQLASTRAMAQRLDPRGR